MPFECVSRTDVGLKRKINEDAVLVRTDRGLWAVADGMGGHEAGEVASAQVTEALLHLPIVYHIDEIVESSIEALGRVNRDLIRLARSDHTPRTIGSTVVGLAIRGGEYRCFWAGDSRAYRVHDGKIAQISRDHSLVQDLVEAGMLDPAEAEGHPDSNVITRAVGVSENLRIDTVGGPAEQGDIFIIGSDGLTRLVEPDELLEQVTTYPTDIAADALLQMVLDRGAPDNVSFVVIRVN
ncbi:MAG TPA: protein phosphatase 2C domain-containing protein [Sphingomicrobium sp.]|nr:protein phosphatase 2C domain-containing protein [Sphingomicrobium sp.]